MRIWGWKLVARPHAESGPVALWADGIGVFHLGGPLSPQVCTGFHRNLAILCCWATTSTVPALAASESAGGALDRLRLGAFSHHAQLSFSTLAANFFSVVLTALWQTPPALMHF